MVLLNLPKVTEVNRFLPKKSIYSKFNVSVKDRDLFDAGVKKITISNEISASSINVSAGDSVGSIYVVHILLKSLDFDERLISKLAKWIDQRILFVLEFEGRSKLAVNHVKLLLSDWSSSDDLSINISGLSLDSVWEGIVAQVGQVRLVSGCSLDEQIVIEDKKQRLVKQIELLEKQARSEKQPKKKFELVQLIRKMKTEMEGAVNDK